MAAEIFADSLETSCRNAIWMKDDQRLSVNFLAGRSSPNDEILSSEKTFNVFLRIPNAVPILLAFLY